MREFYDTILEVSDRFRLDRIAGCYLPLQFVTFSHLSCILLYFRLFFSQNVPQELQQKIKFLSITYYFLSPNCAESNYWRLIKYHFSGWSSHRVWLHLLGFSDARFSNRGRIMGMWDSSRCGVYDNDRSFTVIAFVIVFYQTFVVISFLYVYRFVAMCKFDFFWYLRNLKFRKFFSPPWLLWTQRNPWSNWLTMAVIVDIFYVGWRAISISNPHRIYFRLTHVNSFVRILSQWYCETRNGTHH